MRASLTVNTKEFEKGIMAVISRVDTGTKKATIEGCKEILALSNKYVPRDTDTLAESGDYEVTGRSPRFLGTITYGVTKDPVNPKTRRPASEYAAIVHEDLTAWHLIGKAKFLEIAILEYAQKFPISYARILKRFTGL